jgi:hypothetical protein
MALEYTVYRNPYDATGPREMKNEDVIVSMLSYDKHI